MNDLVQQYPKDEQLLVWAGSWLFHQKEYELAQKRLEQAVAIDADFAAARERSGLHLCLPGRLQAGFWCYAALCRAAAQRTQPAGFLCRNSANGWPIR